MRSLFESTTINGMTLNNRLVRSATWEGMCDDSGRPTEKLIACYRDLARGGIGLIISGYSYVRAEGKQQVGKMGIDRDDLADAHLALTGAVHETGGTLAIQIVHAGGQAPAKNLNRKPVAPSAVKVDQFPDLPDELTPAEIEEIIAAFGQAATRAKTWGYDGVQLHGAHGYLINQFLSPHTNRRTDEYGGGIENRCRFLMAVYRNVRQAVGNNYPVMIKLNAADNLEGGLTAEDGLYAAGLLSAAGIDTIEVSAGTSASGAKNPARTRISRPEKEAYNLDLALRIKAEVDCPVMIVGGLRSFAVAQQTVADHGLDYIALSRPLIREPDLPHRWQQGNREPAKCISCNGCFKPGREEGGIYCVAEKKERQKAEKP